MDELRTLIQSKLEEINDLKVTSEIPDSMLVEGTTYFSYNLQKTYINSDFDRNYTYRINLIGYVKRLENAEENTLKITDDISDKIEEKLKELNIKSNYIDISVLDGVRKKQVSAECLYNEINKTIV